MSLFSLAMHLVRHPHYSTNTVLLACDITNCISYGVLITNTILLLRKTSNSTAHPPLTYYELIATHSRSVRLYLPTRLAISGPDVLDLSTQHRHHGPIITLHLFRQMGWNGYIIITIQHSFLRIDTELSLAKYYSINIGFIRWMMDDGLEWIGLVRETPGRLWLMDMISTWHASLNRLIWIYLRGYIVMPKC